MILSPSTCPFLCSNPDECMLYASLTYNKPLITELDLMQKSLSKSLSKNSQKQGLSLSLKKYSNSYHIYMDNYWFHNPKIFDLVGLPFQDDLKRNKQIFWRASSEARKRILYSSSYTHQYTLYNSPIRPALKYCFHIWGKSDSSITSIFRQMFKF